jgi:hypothetical protein
LAAFAASRIAGELGVIAEDERPLFVPVTEVRHDCIRTPAHSCRRAPIGAARATLIE